MPDPLTSGKYKEAPDDDPVKGPTERGKVHSFWLI